MRKYLTLVKITFQEDLFYRTNFFFYFFREFLWFFVEIILWRVAFRGGGTIAGYNYSQIFRYFLIVRLVRILSVTGVDVYLGELIRSGDLSKYLLRPISFLWAIFFHQLGRRLYRFLYVGGLFLVFILFGLMKIDLVKMLFFSLIVINAMLLTFLYRFFLGHLAFWLINATSVLWFLGKTGNFLAGGWLPLAF